RPPRAPADAHAVQQDAFGAEPRLQPARDLLSRDETIRVARMEIARFVVLQEVRDRMQRLVEVPLDLGVAHDAARAAAAHDEIEILEHAQRIAYRVAAHAKALRELG